MPRPCASLSLSAHEFVMPARGSRGSAEIDRRDRPSRCYRAGVPAQIRAALSRRVVVVAVLPQVHARVHAEECERPRAYEQAAVLTEQMFPSRVSRVKVSFAATCGRYRAIVVLRDLRPSKRALERSRLSRGDSPRTGSDREGRNRISETSRGLPRRTVSFINASCVVREMISDLGDGLGK